MKPAVKSGADLLREMAETEADTPALWWLGQSGFAIKYFSIVFYVDPCLATPRGRTRIAEAPLAGEQVHNADLILCTHRHEGHMNSGTLPHILQASRRARVVLPKSNAGHAFAIGIPYERMTTTDADLRVEYFKEGLYGRVYSVPSAHPELEYTPLGGYPHLGYLLRFGETTLYHAGDGVPYAGLAERLKPYNVQVALLPINGNGNFDITQAAQLAEDIGTRWLVPMHYGTFAEQNADIGRFVDHMLGFRPATGFKVFEAGERWIVPGEYT